MFQQIQTEKKLNNNYIQLVYVLIALLCDSELFPNGRIQNKTAIIEVGVAAQFFWENWNMSTFKNHRISSHAIIHIDLISIIRLKITGNSHLYRNSQIKIYLQFFREPAFWVALNELDIFCFCFHWIAVVWDLNALLRKCIRILVGNRDHLIKWYLFSVAVIIF